MRRAGVRLALALMLSGTSGVATAAESLFKVGADSADRLAAAFSCPTETLDALQSQHTAADPTRRVKVTPSDRLLCLYARDALCASTPDASACEGLDPVGAYGGYYLSRHLMPLVMALRAELTSAQDDRRDVALLRAGLTGIGRLLDLLDPGLNGCTGYRSVRTWCSSIGGKQQLSTSHRYAIAHVASEMVRLLVECRQMGERCPIARDAQMSRRLALWFDLLAWDHVLLDATPIRNSFTLELLLPAQLSERLVALAGDAVNGHDARAPFLFQAEGRALAVAANLLVVDRLLSGDDDPRVGGFSAAQREQIVSTVERGVEVLNERRSATQLFDFAGQPVEGALYDAFGWDRHPYRRFSAIASSERPFDVSVNGAAPQVVFSGDNAAMARGVGLDTGHYRRLVWLHDALDNAARVLERSWSDTASLEALANQFAYAIYQHPCRSGSCESIANDRATPRFANYASGIDGWYRLLPQAPCEAGVPPSGFSLQMMLSENLWWARFNPDVTQIWQHLHAAIANPSAAAPSAGDTVPCGPKRGTRAWHQSYHAIANSRERVDRYYATAFIAMLRWASFTLDTTD